MSMFGEKPFYLLLLFEVSLTYLAFFTDIQTFSNFPTHYKKVYIFVMTKNSI